MAFNESPPMTAAESLAFYRDAYTKAHARAEALEASRDRLFEQAAQHTEAYGIVCAERDRALNALSEAVSRAERVVKENSQYCAYCFCFEPSGKSGEDMLQGYERMRVHVETCEKNPNYIKARAAMEYAEQFARFAATHRTLLGEILERTGPNGDMADAAVCGLAEQHIAFPMTPEAWAEYERILDSAALSKNS